MPPVPLEAALAAQDWADLSRRLTRFAFNQLRGSSMSVAEDLAQEAITNLLDSAYASWDRERHPDIFDCLGSIVNGLVQNHFRLAKRRGKHVPLRGDDATHDDEDPPLPGEDDSGKSEKQLKKLDERDAREALPPDAAHPSETRTAEDLLTQRPLQSRNDEIAMATLLARIANDTLCPAILERMKTGDGRAAADAAALGVPVADIYAARRRLMHHARAVARDLAAGGES